MGAESFAPNYSDGNFVLFLLASILYPSIVKKITPITLSNQNTMSYDHDNDYEDSYNTSQEVIQVPSHTSFHPYEKYCDCDHCLSMDPELAEGCGEGDERHVENEDAEVDDSEAAFEDDFNDFAVDEEDEHPKGSTRPPSTA